MFAALTHDVSAICSPPFFWIPAIATIQLDILQRPRPVPSAHPVVALVGNPNAGKTTLFNALTGLRAKTANFPGTTVEHRTADVTLGGKVAQIIDLPGLYSLAAATPEEQVAADAIRGQSPGLARPSLLVLILDATNLERNLYLASQVMDLEMPTVVALNMVDLARKSGVKVDPQALARELGCPVVPVAARSGEGIEQLRRQLELLLETPESAPRPRATACSSCPGCQFKARYDWAEALGSRVASPGPHTPGRYTQAIDRVLTHPLVGIVAFLAVMFGVFALIFWIADYPMAGVEWLFATVGGYVSFGVDSLVAAIPDGAVQQFVDVDLRSLLVEGIIGGVGGMLVFLPQICILFFFLALLEDTGYLARAAFVMDRLMRRVGLPGKAFVPMLSAHACAIPGIMATRVIEDRRDRLVTILVLPLLTCSARIPVYTMVMALLFGDQPLQAAMLFTGAYVLGIIAALGMAWVFKKTILRGQSKPLVLELPSYKVPSLRNALLTVYDRATLFVRKAGTTILVISVILWAMATYPRAEAPAEALALRQQAQTLQSPDQAQQAAELLDQADRMESQHALAHSFAGRFGHWIEPAIAPLGFNWQIGIGIASSFAAREVIVSTLAVVYGVGADTAEGDPDRLYDSMRNARRTHGDTGLTTQDEAPRVFNTATCVSILVFYVLAMQCLPTQVVTRRETGTWKWPVVQFAYMTVLAYVAALIAYQTLAALGFA